MSDGSFGILFGSGISKIVMTSAVLLFLLPVLQIFLRKFRASKA
jgi:hypothetical protein